MNCEQSEALLAQLVFDDLKPKVKKELSEHVEGCEKCRALAGDMRVAAKLLTEGVHAGPDPKLSGERREKLVAVAAGVGGGDEPKPRRRRVARAARRGHWVPLIALAATMLLAFSIAAGSLPAGCASKKPASMAPAEKYEPILAEDRAGVADEVRRPAATPEPAAPAPAASRPRRHDRKGKASRGPRDRAVSYSKSSRMAEGAAEPKAAPRGAARREAEWSIPAEREIPVDDIGGRPVFIHEEVEVEDHMETANANDGGPGRMLLGAEGPETDMRRLATFSEPMSEPAEAEAFADTGLVAHWKLDDANGPTAADASVNGNVGTLSNMAGTEWTTGQVGGALQFDGSDDFVGSGEAVRLDADGEWAEVSTVAPDDYDGRLTLAGTRKEGDEAKNKVIFYDSFTGDLAAEVAGGPVGGVAPSPKKPAKSEATRRREQLDKMHSAIVKQQQALEVAKERAGEGSRQRVEMERKLNNAEQRLTRTQKRQPPVETAARSPAPDVPPQPRDRLLIAGGHTSRAAEAPKTGRAARLARARKAKAEKQARDKNARDKYVKDIRRSKKLAKEGKWDAMRKLQKDARAEYNKRLREGEPAAGTGGRAAARGRSAASDEEEGGALGEYDYWVRSTAFTEPATRAKIEKLVREGTDLFEAGRYDDARERLKQALKEDPKGEVVSELGEEVLAQMMTEPKMGREPQVIYDLYRLHVARAKGPLSTPDEREAAAREVFKDDREKLIAQLRDRKVKAAAAKRLDELAGEKRQPADKAAAARSRYFKDVGRKFYEEMKYVEARESLQRAVALDPSNKQAREHLDKVNDVLGDRTPQVATSLERLADQKRVAVSEQLVELDTLLDRARKSLPISLRESVAPSPEYQVRVYSRALRDAQRAQEVIKWMPYQIDVGDKKAEADKLVAEARKARDEALTALGVDLGTEVAQLKKEKSRLEKDLHHNSWVVQRLMEHGVPVNDIIQSGETQPATPIDGRILAVRPEVNLVMLSAGSDDGVKRGHRLTVYRGEQYIGKVEVEKVFGDMASARILVDWTKEDIRENDAASTSVYGGGSSVAKVKRAAGDEWWLQSTGLTEEFAGRTPRAKPRTARRPAKAERTQQAAVPPSQKFAQAAASPRQLATQRLMGIEPKGKPAEGATKTRAAPEAQQFVVLSDRDARVIEKQAQAKLALELRRQLQAAQAPGVGVVVEDTGELEPEPELEESEPPPEPDALPKAPPAPAPPVNPFVMTKKDRFSTFAMDVDTASYTIARKYIRGGYLPPPRVVRMEEFVNSFDYNYPKRSRDVFDIHSEGMPSPFGKNLKLLKIGVQARIVGREGQKPAHLVFVIDTSGSMDKPDRLPLVQHALGLLVGQLAPHDIVTVVAYGTRPRLILESVSASRQGEITGTIRSLQCGGSTNLVGGLRLGYEQAKRGFRTGAVNRVILCSDGVANVGASEAEEILKEIETSRDWGVTLTVAGFGAGSYDDSLLEKLADSGDGHYIFIDSRAEARRVFVEELGATLHTVAKDSKIQVEFDPRAVRRYRLVGYENRDIADKDFRNDAIDAGEVGSGQSVTALYEIELFERAGAHGSAADVGTVYVRYRNLETGEVEEISHRLRAAAIRQRSPEGAPRLYLAACAAEFAEILRGSEHAADGDLAEVERLLRHVDVQLPLDKKLDDLLWLAHRAQGLPRAP